MQKRAILIALFVCGVAYTPLALAATVQSHTSATADSGGNVVGSGGRVVTGSQSASASSYTNISGNGSGTATVSVSINDNGVTRTEERQVNIPTGASVSVSVSTTSVRSAPSGQNTSISVPTSSAIQKVQQVVQHVIGQVAAHTSPAPSEAVLISAGSNNVNTNTNVNPFPSDVNANAPLFTANWLSGLYKSVRSFVSGIFATFSFSSS